MFNNTVTSVTSVSVKDAALLDAGVATPGFNGNELVVTLTGVADAKRVTVSATGVNGALNVSASIGFLLGDSNNNRVVNATDVSRVKSYSGQVTTQANFTQDLNASGLINAAEIAAVKTRSGNTLP